MKNIFGNRNEKKMNQVPQRSEIAATAPPPGYGDVRGALVEIVVQGGGPVQDPTPGGRETGSPLRGLGAATGNNTSHCERFFSGSRTVFQKNQWQCTAVYC